LKNDLLSREKWLYRAATSCVRRSPFMVQDDERVGLDGLQVKFDDERVVRTPG